MGCAGRGESRLLGMGHLHTKCKAVHRSQVEDDLQEDLGISMVCKVYVQLFVQERNEKGAALVFPGCHCDSDW